MKILLIIRHAKTHQADWGEKDFDRKLTNRGENNAIEIAEFLDKQKLEPDYIICSPAKRTKQTAKIFAKHCGYNQDDIFFYEDLYEGNVGNYQTAISQIKNSIKVAAIVGHNPGISMFAALATDDLFNGHMPTGSVVGVQAAVKEWKDYFTAPKKLLFFEIPKGHL